MMKQIWRHRRQLACKRALLGKMAVRGNVCHIGPSFCNTADKQVKKSWSSGNENEYKKNGGEVYGNLDSEPVH